MRGCSRRVLYYSIEVTTITIKPWASENAAGELNHTEIKTFPQKFSNIFQSEAWFSASLPNQGPVYCFATVPAAGQLNHTEVKISSASTQFATVPALE